MITLSPLILTISAIIFAALYAPRAIILRSQRARASRGAALRVRAAERRC